MQNCMPHLGGSIRNHKPNFGRTIENSMPHLGVRGGATNERPGTDHVI